MCYVSAMVKKKKGRKKEEGGVAVHFQQTDWLSSGCRGKTAELMHSGALITVWLVVFLWLLIGDLVTSACVKYNTW